MRVCSSKIDIRALSRQQVEILKYVYILLFMADKPYPDYLTTVSPEVCVANNLHRVAQHIVQAYEQSLKPSGITISQFSTLGTLHMHGSLPISMLADVMDVDRTTLARNLKLMVRDGLVAITRKEDDQRVKVVSITPEGLQTLEMATPMWQKAQQHFVINLGEDVVADLIETLMDVRELIETV